MLRLCVSIMKRKRYKAPVVLGIDREILGNSMTFYNMINKQHFLIPFIPPENANKPRSERRPCIPNRNAENARNQRRLTR